MNKIILVILYFGAYFVIYASNLQAQNRSATARVILNVIEPSNVGQVKYVTSFSNKVQISNDILGAPIFRISDNGKMMNNAIQKLASFSVTTENMNSFSISLPSQPLILRDLKSSNSVQVDNWKTSGQLGKNEFQKNVWIINLGASMNMQTDKTKQEGAFFGTYLVNIVYN